MTDAFTVKQLRDLLTGIDDHYVVILGVTEDPDDRPEHDIPDYFRAAIRSADCYFKDARQVDGEQADICIVEILISDF